MIEVILAFLILYFKYRERLSSFNYDTFNSFLVKQESKFGTFKWGLVQTSLLMLAVFLYARPSSHCAFMGKYYAALAANPFSFDPANPVPHRILTSLISYLIGMRGQLIIITNLLIAAGLIYVVYWYFRKLKSEPADAFLASAIIAFSIVTLNTVYYGGYNDSLSYLLIFLMWTLRKQRIVFYLLFFLGLMNRESVAFLIPWFALISFERSGSRGKRVVELVIGLGVALGLYSLFRYWITQHQEIEYSAGYYLGKFWENPLGMLKYHFNYVGLAFFAVFKLLWIVPIAAAISMWRNGIKREFVGMALLIFCSAAQLLIAYDTTRLLTLSFMVMPISLYFLYQTNAFEFRKWIIPLFAFNLLVPNINVAGLKIDVMHSLISYAISYVIR